MRIRFKQRTTCAGLSPLKVNGCRSKFKSHTGGYTLLELLLSLALSVLMVGVIGTSIQLYLVSLTRIQTSIERKQIARGLIEMISNDLRAGVQYKAADYGDLENLVQTQLLAVNNVAEQFLDTETDDEVDATEIEEEADLVIEEEAASFRPSLFGTANSVAVDISRLPRLDQYNAIVAGEDSELQTPSDIKTLAYFFSTAEPVNSDPVAFSRVASGGLYRRQIDRAVAAHSGVPSLVASPDEYCDLVASEVAEIRFRYFDGEGWQSEWDSEENGGFPLAIEVILVIDPARSTSGQDYQFSGDGREREQYRRVIHLPAAELPLEEEEQ